MVRGQGKRGTHTPINQEHLNTEIGVAHAHEEDVFDAVIQLEVVVPDVAHEVLDLGLQRALVSARGVGIGVLRMRDVVRYIDVHDGKVLADGPVDVAEDAIGLYTISQLPILSFGEAIIDLPPKHCAAQHGYQVDQAAHEVPD